MAVLLGCWVCVAWFGATLLCGDHLHVTRYGDGCDCHGVCARTCTAYTRVVRRLGFHNHTEALSQESWCWVRVSLSEQ